MGNRINLQRISLVPDLDCPGSFPVSVHGVRERLSFLQGHILFIQVNAGGIVDGFLVENIQECVHRVLHAEAADQQYHAADNPEERHQAPRLVPYAVPQVPLRPEAEAFEPLRFLKAKVLHAFRGIGAQRVRGGSPQHLPHRQESDECEERDNRKDHIPGKARRVQRPGRDIDICRHGAVRVHNKISESVSNPDSEDCPEQADDQRIGGIMYQDPPVLESQRFQGADLDLLAGADPVHGGYHGQDRDRQEQHRQDGRHGLSFIDFSLGFSPGNRLSFGQDQPCISQRFVRRFHKLRFVHCGLHINLVIQRSDECPVQCRYSVVQHDRRNIGISVGGIIRHHLIRVRQADHIFAGFDQSPDGSGNRDGLVGQRQRIPDGDSVRPGIGIRQPEAVRVLRIVRFSLHQQDP